ncbi:MAG: hypothetical protein AAF441_21320 [Pseudomonadota bacterium]
MQLKTFALAAALAAFSLPAWGQQCQPAQSSQAFLDAHGWEMYSATTTPNGDAIVVYCNGDRGALIHEQVAQGLSCVIGTAPAVCRVPELPGTES